MGPSRINPLLCLLAATLVIRALRERREGSPLRLPDRPFHDLGGSRAHIARHPPRSWKPGVPSRSNPRVNNLRARNRPAARAPGRRCGGPHARPARRACDSGGVDTSGDEPGLVEANARRMRRQAVACEELGSPLYARLLEHAAADLEAGGP